MRSEGSTNALDLIVIDSAAPFQCNAPDCTRVAGHMGPHRA